MTYITVFWKAAKLCTIGLLSSIFHTLAFTLELGTFGFLRAENFDLIIAKIRGVAVARTDTNFPEINIPAVSSLH